MSQIINLILNYYIEILFFFFLINLVVVSRSRIVRLFKKLALSIEFFDKLVSQKAVNLYDEYSRFTKAGCRGIFFRFLFLRNIYWLLPILYMLAFFGVTKTISSLEDGNCAHAMETPADELTEDEARRAMLGSKLDVDIDYCINNLEPDDLISFIGGMEKIWASTDTRAMYTFAQKYESPSFETNTDLDFTEYKFKMHMKKYLEIVDSYVFESDIVNSTDKGAADVASGDLENTKKSQNITPIYKTPEFQLAAVGVALIVISGVCYFFFLY